MRAQFITAEEVQKILGISRSKSYQIIRDLNKELKSMCCVNATWPWRSSGLPAWALLPPFSQQIVYTHMRSHTDL